eukprot:c22865_g1_i1 orf=309-1832(-)
MMMIFPDHFDRPSKLPTPPISSTPAPSSPLPLPVVSSAALPPPLHRLPPVSILVAPTSLLKICPVKKSKRSASVAAWTLRALIRVVFFLPKGSRKGRVQCIEESERAWRELEVKSCASGSRRDGPTIDTDGRRQQQRESKPPEELPERLLGKIFSEPGVNFASAVVGNMACNIVKALFDAFESQTITGTNGGKPNVSETAEKEKAAISKVVDVLCTQQCRGLITECIQTLVSTTVSVYVDKTKDVNFYDDMVAGITNPSHKDPMKDLLTTVCNGAIETLVKSSHNVMFASKSGQPESDGRHQNFQQEQWAVEEISDGPHVQSQLSVCTPALSISRKIKGEGMIMSADDHASTSSSNSEGCEVSAPMILEPNMEGILQDPERQIVGETSQRPRRDSIGVQSFIDGVSKTLAIPSNHKLVVDVAGTMTSEAVRSFVDVVVSTVSSNLHDKMKRGWGRMRHGASEQDGNSQALQCQARHKDMAIKSFFLASICLAICLHMLTGVYIRAQV